MTEELHVLLHQATMTIIIDRPQQRNAMTLDVASALAAALTELDARPDLSVAILTGAGGTFCSGMDLARFVREGERPVVAGRGFGGLTEAPPRKPIIAAVEGWALGGGFELALACDLIVAGTGASFGLPEVRRGLVARAGGLLRIAERLPRNVAMEVALSGRPISALRAAELGLVNRLVEDGQALAMAADLAEAISSNAPLAVAASKQVLTESRDWVMSSWWERQQLITDNIFSSHDAAEGARAFAEKRQPCWQGR